MDHDSGVRSLFSSAKSIRQKLETSPDPSAASYQEALQKAISQLEECRKLIDSLSFFSVNESVEDVSSGELQYGSPPHDIIGSRWLT